MTAQIADNWHIFNMDKSDKVVKPGTEECQKPAHLRNGRTETGTPGPLLDCFAAISIIGDNNPYQGSPLDIIARGGGEGLLCRRPRCRAR